MSQWKLFALTFDLCCSAPIINKDLSRWEHEKWGAEFFSERPHLQVLLFQMGLAWISATAQAGLEPWKVYLPISFLIKVISVAMGQTVKPSVLLSCPFPTGCFGCPFNPKPSIWRINEKTSTCQHGFLASQVETLCPWHHHFSTLSFWAGDAKSEASQHCSSTYSRPKASTPSTPAFWFKREIVLGGSRHVTTWARPKKESPNTDQPRHLKVQNVCIWP